MAARPARATATALKPARATATAPKSTRGREIAEMILEQSDDVQKYIILLAAAEGGPIRGRIKLQKMMFLVSELVDAVGAQGSYDSDYYGPYSEVVDAECEYLEQIGVLRSGPGGIAATLEGREAAEELARGEDGTVMMAVAEYKELLGDPGTGGGARVHLFCPQGDGRGVRRVREDKTPDGGPDIDAQKAQDNPPGGRPSCSAGPRTM